MPRQATFLASAFLAVAIVATGALWWFVTHGDVKKDDGPQATPVRAEEHRFSNAKVGIARLASSADAFRLNHDRLPSSLRELTETVVGHDPLIRVSELIDPWGKPYELDARPDGSSGRAVVFSTGSGKRIDAEK